MNETRVQIYQNGYYPVINYGVVITEEESVRKIFKNTMGAEGSHRRVREVHSEESRPSWKDIVKNFKEKLELHSGL